MPLLIKVKLNKFRLEGITEGGEKVLLNEPVPSVMMIYEGVYRKQGNAKLEKKAREDNFYYYQIGQALLSPDNNSVGIPYNSFLRRS